MAHTLLSTTEAAAALHLDRSVLVKWVRMGRLTPAQKLPGRTGAYLFHRADVERLAEARGGAA